MFVKACHLCCNLRLATKFCCSARCGAGTTSRPIVASSAVRSLRLAGNRTSTPYYGRIVAQCSPSAQLTLLCLDSFPLTSSKALCDCSHSSYHDSCTFLRSWFAAYRHLARMLSSPSEPSWWSFVPNVDLIPP